MRRMIMALTTVGLVAALVVQGRAGADGDETGAIIAKAIKAHAPNGTDDKKQAYIGTNKGTIYVQGLELEFTQNVYLQTTSGKFKEVMEMSVMGTGVKTITVFNGKEGWIKVSVNNNDMDIPVKDELLDEFKEMSYMIAIGQLSGLKDKNIKLSLIGDAQVNGKPAVGVRISREGKKDLSLYFDKETGLMAKTERRAVDFQSKQEVTEERIVTSYQDVDGRKMAKKVTVTRDGKKLLDADVIEAKSLDKLDDSEFAKP